MKLIVGLGNPGKQFERTRHNVGWMILDVLAGKETWRESKAAQANYVKMEIDEKRVELLKPNAFMNNSGVAVAYAVKKHGLNLNNLVVIHDDKDIPLGEFRVQIDRGAAGHNGVSSIIEHLGTKNFLRIRVGVAPIERPIGDTADFVLGKFTKDEQKILHGVIERAVEEVKKIIV